MGEIESNMLSYMEYIQRCFYDATAWGGQNSYASIAETVENLLDFEMPQGVSLNISSQTTPNTCTSYKLANLGLVNGSIAYLYSSTPLLDVDNSREIRLQDAVAGYKMLGSLREPDYPEEVYYRGERVGANHNLLYGRLFLPGSSLEAMVIRRLSRLSQLLVTCVSDSRLKNNGAITFIHQRDTGKWCQELIYSTHETLLGYRGLYNVGFDRKVKFDPSRLSVGFEMFYGVSNKSPGLSTGLRYTTQSAYTGTPVTMTLMSNPLMGHISATYALRTTTASAFASRFDFNVYSYLSELSIGCEIWRKARQGEQTSDEFTSILKASATMTNPTVKVLWEGRYRDFLISSGVGLSRFGPDLNATVGIEFQFSS